jgi:hypothetical protein
MLDPHEEAFNALAKQTAFGVSALSQLLISKGLVTNEELTEFWTSFQPQFDQEWEAAMRAKNKRMLEENPGMGLAAKIAGAEILLP